MASHALNSVMISSTKQSTQSSATRNRLTMPLATSLFSAISESAVQLGNGLSDLMSSLLFQNAVPQVDFTMSSEN